MPRSGHFRWYRHIAAKLLAAGALVASAGMVQASFVVISEGGQGDQVLDTTTNLIWLKSWSAAGLGNWQTQKSWAAGVTTGGLAAGTWRLPTGDGAIDGGPDNEFWQLWIDVGSSLAGLKAQFDNVHSDFYWSGTQGSDVDAWYFGTRDGFQKSTDANYYPLFAVAVRSADVVPVLSEPDSWALLLAGTLIMAGLARVRKRA